MNGSTKDKVAEKVSGKLWQAGGKAVGLGSTTSNIIGQVCTPTMLGGGDEYVSGRPPARSPQPPSMWSQSDVGTTKLDLAASLHSKGFKK